MSVSVAVDEEWLAFLVEPPDGVPEIHCMTAAMAEVHACDRECACSPITVWSGEGAWSRLLVHQQPTGGQE